MFRPIVACLLFVAFLLPVRNASASELEYAYTPPQGVQAHILRPGDVALSWTDADRVALRRAGLPAPEVVTTATNVLQTSGARTSARQAASSSGWRPLLRSQWRPGIVHPRCRTLHETASVGARIDEQLRRTVAQSSSVASDDDVRVSRWVCVFDNLAQARNLMVEFALRLEPRVFEESLFVGVSTDGRNFLGRRWYAPKLDESATRWQTQRIFFPLMDRQSNPNGRIAVLWELRRPRRFSQPIGVIAGAVSVERFDPPVASCRTLDPAMTVVDAPGSGRVSKGVNLPPYPDAIASGLAGHVERLQQSGVHWVRVEWQGRAGNGVRAATLSGRAAQLGYIDLKHYDILLALLCSGEPEIAVLALLDYATSPDDGWRHRPKQARYRAAFVEQAEFLARYYGDRVRAWEIWNEPDHSNTYLPPAEFARLLAAAASAIKRVAPDALIVSGGLSSAGVAAAAYLRQTLSALVSTSPDAGFDVLGVHLYPTIEYRNGAQVIREPSYLYAHQPTVLARLMRVLAAAGFADLPIWVTETGWNRAGDSGNAANLACSLIAAKMVTGVEQAAYLPALFDILYKETGWSDTIPGVEKIFWYQYNDVGLTAQEAGCNDDGIAPTAVVDWWYGLYSGIDPAAGIVEPQSNRVACTFLAYPDAEAIDRCLAFGF